MGVPQKQRQYVITNFDYLLQYTDSVMVLLSALLYYIDIFNELFDQSSIETKTLKNEICIYLLTITH